MKYEIHLTEEDYLRFNMFHIDHSKMGKRAKNRLRARAPLLSVFAIFILIIARAEPQLIVMEAIALTVFSTILAAFASKRIKRAVRRKIKKMKAEGKQLFIPESEIEFQDLRIVDKSERGEMYINYHEIEEVYVEENALYIYPTEARAFIIPRRCLGDDWERVIAYITERIKR